MIYMPNEDSFSADNQKFFGRCRQGIRTRAQAKLFVAEQRALNRADERKTSSAQKESPLGKLCYFFESRRESSAGVL